MKILHYFNYREFPDGNHRIREELSSYGSAGDEIKNREAPDKNVRVGMSADYPTFNCLQYLTISLIVCELKNFYGLIELSIVHCSHYIFNGHTFCAFVHFVHTFWLM